MNNLLKSCPFCGGGGSVTIDPEGVRDSKNRKWAYTVSCDKCCASTGLCWSREMAIDVWKGEKTMPRYIDAEKLCELARNHITRSVDCNDIMRFPIADVQKVKHGKWDVKDLTPYCSICHSPSEYECDGVHSKPLFCPNCGAKMDGGESE